MDAATKIGEVLLQESGSIQIRVTAQFLWVLELEEEVEMADDDANDRVHFATGQDNVEREQHPRKVHGLEAGAEPKVDNGILVQLAPDIQHGQDHWVHEEL